MSFNPKEIALVLLVILATGGLVRYCTPEKVVYSTGEQEQKLDSLTTLSRNLVVSKSQLQDSLKETSQAFQDYVEHSEDEIASYSRITGQLRLVVDSLEQASSMVGLADLINTDSSASSQFRDTTITASATFGDSLMKSTAKAGIRNDSLFLDPPIIEQLRMVRLDVAVSVAGDHSRVNTVVTSPDFDSLRVASLTPLEPKKRFPWTEITAVAAFILGYAL